MNISKEVKVGLFAISSLVLLYFGFYYLKGIDFFSTDKKYYAVYTNIDKLTESNQIFLNGLAVGRVSNTQIQQNKNRVIVELSIDSEIVLNKASVAVLNGELLGGRFIQLIPGKSPELLAPKDTINTDVAKGLTELIAENAQPVAANLQTTLAKLNSILDTLALSAVLVNETLSDFRTTSRRVNSALGSARGNLDSLTSTYDQVGRKLSTSLSNLQPTLENFKILSDSLKMIELNGTVKKAQVAITNLNQTLEKLNKGDNSASKFLTEDSLYVNLNNLLQNLDSLATHFNENPRHFLAPLGKSSKKIKRALDKENK
mgnify:CR=1 FL=1